MVVSKIVQRKLFLLNNHKKKRAFSPFLWGSAFLMHKGAQVGERLFPYRISNKHIFENIAQKYLQCSKNVVYS